jgi:hypothetical protein
MLDDENDELTTEPESDLSEDTEFQSGKEEPLVEAEDEDEADEPVSESSYPEPVEVPDVPEDLTPEEERTAIRKAVKTQVRRENIAAEARVDAEEDEGEEDDSDLSDLTSLTDDDVDDLMGVDEEDITGDSDGDLSDITGLSENDKLDLFGVSKEDVQGRRPQPKRVKLVRRPHAAPGDYSGLGGVRG